MSRVEGYQRRNSARSQLDRVTGWCVGGCEERAPLRVALDKGSKERRKHLDFVFANDKPFRRTSSPQNVRYAVSDRTSLLAAIRLL